MCRFFICFHLLGFSTGKNMAGNKPAFEGRATNCTPAYTKGITKLLIQLMYKA